MKVVAFGALTLVPVAQVGALDPLGSVCNENPNSEICASQPDKAEDLIKNLVNILLFVVGLLAVIMIIVSGILYITSSGDAGKVARAKNTLTYSIVGLVIAFVAFAIVNWVVGKLS